MNQITAWEILIEALEAPDPVEKMEKTADMDDNIKELINEIRGTCLTIGTKRVMHEVHQKRLGLPHFLKELFRDPN